LISTLIKNNTFIKKSHYKRVVALFFIPIGWLQDIPSVALLLICGFADSLRRKMKPYHHINTLPHQQIT
ncbi:MAG TPA: hypothetical protein PJ990_15980, partial [Saprospiraceae bacterium]|nr:hypothetical protein [Saprospiraceae bacterium]